MVGFDRTTCVAKVLHLTTGVMNTYPLPPCPSHFWASMTDSLITGNSGSTWPVYDYVAGTWGEPLTPPTGNSSPTTPWVSLMSSGGVLWEDADRQTFAYAPSVTAAPSPWTKLQFSSGEYASAFTTTQTQLLYAKGTSSIELCSLPLSNLSAAPSCTSPVWVGNLAGLRLRNYGSTTLVSGYADLGNTGMLSWSGTTVTQVAIPAGSLVWNMSLGDTPYVLLLDATFAPSLRRVNADGSLGSAMPLPTALSVPTSLALSPDRALVMDYRDGTGLDVGGQAWSRPVSAAGFGSETLTQKDTWTISASAGRSVRLSWDGLEVFDRTTQSYSDSSGYLGQDASYPPSVSGPYVSLPDNFDSQTTIIKADGPSVGTFPMDGVLFGSIYYSVTRPNGGTGPTQVTANDLTGKTAARTITLATGGVACTGVVVWNDRIGMSCNNAADVFSLTTGQLEYSKTSQGGLTVTALGDGYAVVHSPGQQVGSTVVGAGTWVWNLKTDSLTDQGACTPNATDGIGHVLCASDTELIWRNYSSLSTSAPRLLGVLAASSVGFGLSAWAPQIDATKPLKAGSLVITTADGTVVKALATPASPDGSLRGLSWDGRDTSGKLVGIGTYTYTLKADAQDGTGAVVSITGDKAATGTFTVTNHAKFVKASYQDFLGRAPTDAEVSSQATALATGKLSSFDYLTGLATSDEWLTTIVTKMYADTLGRAPDAAGLSFWTGLLRNKTFTVADVASRFYSSDEYYTLHAGGTPQSWVTNLYSKLLNRAPDPGGLQYWSTLTTYPSWGRDKVAYFFYQSEESRMDRVQALYQLLLGREPDPTGWPFWTQRVLSTGDITLAIELANSDEYLTRAQTRY